MYEEFLSAILAYIRGLNAAEKETVSDTGLVPYAGQIPVMLDTELCGFLVDEVGGSWSYRDATPEDRAWWSQRPWKEAGQ